MESSRQPSSAPTALPTFYSEDLMNEAASDESVFRDLLQKVGSHKGESGVRERQETGTWACQPSPCFAGAPGGIRTPDQWLRRPL